MAFLNKGLKITLLDRRDPEYKQKVFHYEGGVVSFVEYINNYYVNSYFLLDNLIVIFYILTI